MGDGRGRDQVREGGGREGERVGRDWVREGGRKRERRKRRRERGRGRRRGEGGVKFIAKKYEDFMRRNKGENI